MSRATSKGGGGEWLESYGEKLEGTSNRQKFKNIPLDEATMKVVTSKELCTPPKQAHKLLTRRLKANKRSATKDDMRYPLYGEIDPEVRSLIGSFKRDKMALAAQAGREKDIPPAKEVEIAFAGRSNVGKSSVINAVALSTCAKSSDKPGKTQSLNFYRLPGRLALVDLPGYGFAFAKKEKVAQWNELMDAYLSGRPNLRKVYVIVDSRTGLKHGDKEMIQFLHEHKLRLQVVLNKTDLTTPADLVRRHTLAVDFLRSIPGANQRVLMLNSATGAGVLDLSRDILSVARPDDYHALSERDRKAKRRRALVAEKKAMASKPSGMSSPRPRRR